MLVTPNLDGWSISADPAAGEYHLVYSDEGVAYYGLAEGKTSTQLTLFVGTSDECAAHAESLGLTLPTPNLD